VFACSYTYTPATRQHAQKHLTKTESIRIAAGEHTLASAGKPYAAATASRSKPTASVSTSKTRSKPIAKVMEAESSPAPSVAGDEEVVSVRSKRTAATKATQRLHNEIMPDVMSYQQEIRSRGKGRRIWVGQVIREMGVRGRSGRQMERGGGCG